MKNNKVRGEERKLDAELKRLGMKSRIYHFTTRCDPFRAITIAVADLTSMNEIREILYKLQSALKFSDAMSRSLGMLPIEPAVRTLRALREMDIYGVAICDLSDNFNRQEGRNKAKGRLVQHLKSMEKGIEK